MRECTKCGKTKPETDYAQRKTRPTRMCLSCEVARNKQWREKNADKRALYDWRTNIKRKYGLTEEQYNELLRRQGECCPICERHASEFPRRLAVDHDHKTGEVFGLLCTYCNHRVVGRRRDPGQYLRAAAYLKEGTGWFVPAKKKRRKK